MGPHLTRSAKSCTDIKADLQLPSQALRLKAHYQGSQQKVGQAYVMVKHKRGMEEHGRAFAKFSNPGDNAARHVMRDIRVAEAKKLQLLVLY